VFSEPNPLSDPGPEPFPQPPLPTAPPTENPVWSGWDVLQIAVLTIVAIVALVMLVALIAQRLLFRGTAFLDVVKLPMVSVAAQLLAYLVVLGFMVLVVKREPQRPFWRSVRWNWPGSAWGVFVICGAVVYFALLGVASCFLFPSIYPSISSLEMRGKPCFSRLFR